MSSDRSMALNQGSPALVEETLKGTKDAGCRSHGRSSPLTRREDHHGVFNAQDLCTLSTYRCNESALRRAQTLLDFSVCLNHNCVQDFYFSDVSEHKCSHSCFRLSLSLSSFLISPQIFLGQTFYPAAQRQAATRTKFSISPRYEVSFCCFGIHIRRLPRSKYQVSSARHITVKVNQCAWATLFLA